MSNSEVNQDKENAISPQTNINRDVALCHIINEQISRGHRADDLVAEINKIGIDEFMKSYTLLPKDPEEASRENP